MPEEIQVTLTFKRAHSRVENNSELEAFPDGVETHAYDLHDPSGSEPGEPMPTIMRVEVHIPCGAFGGEGADAIEKATAVVRERINEDIFEALSAMPE